MANSTWLLQHTAAFLDVHSVACLLSVSKELRGSVVSPSDVSMVSVLASRLCKQSTRQRARSVSATSTAGAAGAAVMFGESYVAPTPLLVAKKAFDPHAGAVTPEGDLRLSRFSCSHRGARQVATGSSAARYDGAGAAGGPGDHDDSVQVRPTAGRLAMWAHSSSCTRIVSTHGVRVVRWDGHIETRTHVACSALRAAATSSGTAAPYVFSQSLRAVEAGPWASDLTDACALPDSTSTHVVSCGGLFAVASGRIIKLLAAIPGARGVPGQSSATGTDRSASVLGSWLAPHDIQSLCFDGGNVEHGWSLAAVKAGHSGGASGATASATASWSTATGSAAASHSSSSSWPGLSNGPPSMAGGVDGHDGLDGSSAHQRPPLLAVGGDDCDAHVIDTRAPSLSAGAVTVSVQAPRHLPITSRAIRAIALQSDVHSLATGHSSGHVLVWDIRRPSAPLYSLSHCTYNGWREEVRDLALLPHASHAVSSSYDGTVRIWELPGGSGAGHGTGYSSSGELGPSFVAHSQPHGPFMCSPSSLGVPSLTLLDHGTPIERMRVYALGAGQGCRAYRVASVDWCGKLKVSAVMLPPHSGSGMAPHTGVGGPANDDSIYGRPEHDPAWIIPTDGIMQLQRGHVRTWDLLPDYAGVRRSGIVSDEASAAAGGGGTLAHHLTSHVLSQAARLRSHLYVDTNTGMSLPPLPLVRDFAMGWGTLPGPDAGDSEPAFAGGHGRSDGTETAVPVLPYVVFTAPGLSTSTGTASGPVEAPAGLASTAADMASLQPSADGETARRRAMCLWTASLSHQKRA